MHIRIISGERKGKNLFTVPGIATRPTSNRVRESVFQILGSRVLNARVLDLFAGTGALGIEALSRGAEFVLFVDYDRKPVSVIRKNLKICRYESHAKVLQLDLLKGSKWLTALGTQFGLAFMDPPYRQQAIPSMLDCLHENKTLSPDALVVAEHGTAEPPLEIKAPFCLKDQRKYGKTLVSFIDYIL